MADLVLVEGDRPVGSVLPHRGGDVEPALPVRQLGVHDDLLGSIQVLGEPPLHLAVCEDEILDVLLGSVCLVEVPFRTVHREDAVVELPLRHVVLDVIHDDGGLLLVDEFGDLLDELLRIDLEHIKLRVLDLLEDGRHGPACESGLRRHLAHEIVLHSHIG